MGYKLHARTDAEGFIEQIHVTPANAVDVKHLASVLDHVEEGVTIYSRRIEKVLRRWLALPYYLYCLRLAALYYFFTSPTICRQRLRQQRKSDFFRKAQIKRRDNA